MSVQLSVNARNGQLDAVETEFGASPILKLRTGAPPANCAAADSGTVLCSISLPADAMAAAASGSKAKSGTWQGTASGGGGTIAHFRMYKTDGTTCVIQGTCATGSGDMPLDNAVVADGQTVTVTGFTLNAGNA